MISKTIRRRAAWLAGSLALLIIVGFAAASTNVPNARAQATTTGLYCLAELAPKLPGRSSSAVVRQDCFDTPQAASAFRADRMGRPIRSRASLRVYGFQSSLGIMKTSLHPGTRHTSVLYLKSL